MIKWLGGDGWGEVVLGYRLTISNSVDKESRNGAMFFLTLSKTVIAEQHLNTVLQILKCQRQNNRAPKY